jgi:hypothetical protein
VFDVVVDEETEDDEILRRLQDAGIFLAVVGCMDTMWVQLGILSGREEE